MPAVEITIFKFICIMAAMFFVRFLVLSVLKLLYPCRFGNHLLKIKSRDTGLVQCLNCDWEDAV